MLLLWCAHAPPAHAGQWMSRTVDGIMGTRIFVELWADDPVKGAQAIDAVMAEMRHIDDSMSTFKPTSEVSKVNRLAAKEPVKISPELFNLLETALYYSRISHGAFDITYASVGYMYDFHTHKRPTAAQIRAALPAIGYKHLLLDPKTRTVRFSMPGVRIDLGGIAKGYAVDQGIDILLARGFKHALVNAGGDSRVIGDRRGRPWMVGIQHPDHPDVVVTRFPLVNEAFSTSGDYERYFIQNGVRYHHIINPHTGDSARQVRSATIIAPTATRTDGLSKTAFVLGANAALKLYNSMPDVAAIIIKPNGQMLYTNNLQPGSLPPPVPPQSGGDAAADAAAQAAANASLGPTSEAAALIPPQGATAPPPGSTTVVSGAAAATTNSGH
ncbi:MAG TPA: FAD:protein FMN transferase [Steroidobacteraceae bacterium]|nr:FAD:protein FMN transferase [Steroidobacteraceae bacterium]